jgi:hypothetical protein
MSMKKDKEFGQLNYKNHAVMRYYYEQNKFGNSLHLHILHDIMLTSLISLFSLFSSSMMMTMRLLSFVLIPIRTSREYSCPFRYFQNK